MSSRRPTDIIALAKLTGQFKLTWSASLALLRATFALPMSAVDLATFCDLTGRTVAPSTPAKELWWVAGRRSGKSVVAALIAVYLSTCRTYRLARGERGVFMVIAADRKQARVVRRYVTGLLKSTPVLAQVIARETTDTIELTNGIAIEIHTASFKTIRGYTVIGAVADEVAYWPTDETSAEPDREILAALRPAMATVPEALLVCLSSPYTRRGELWRTFEAHYGRDHDDVLVVRAETRALNPTVSERTIARAYRDDALRARSEYGAEFRDDTAALLDDAAITAVTPLGVRELAPVAGRRTVAHFDAATGSGEDSAALAIAFGAPPELAAARRWRPPFSPAAVVREAAQMLRRYGVSTTTIDRYAPNLIIEAFREHRITATVATRDTSTAFIDLLALINSRRVALLDEPTVMAELRRLERRPGASGRDSVGHPPRGHDDVAAACAQALCAAASTYRKPAKRTIRSYVWGSDVEPQAARRVVGQQAVRGADGRLTWQPVYADQVRRPNPSRGGLSLEVKR